MRWFALTSRSTPAQVLRITSGSLRVMNTTGATVTVDVGIQDYADRIQFAAPGSQSPVVSDFTAYNFTVGSPVAHIIVNAHNGTNYQVDEQVTISGAIDWY